MEEVRLSSASDDGLTRLAHRQFLKTLLGTAAGLAGVATAGTLLTPATAEAAYSPGTAPDGGDLVNTNLTVQGNVTIEGPHPWVDVRTHLAGAQNPLIDDAPLIKNAIDSLGANGGTVFFPAGYTFYCHTPIDLVDRKNIQLVSDATAEAATLALPATLLYTGNHPHFLGLHSAEGIVLRGLSLRYNNASFTGALVYCARSGANNPDPRFLRFEKCSFSGMVTLSDDTVTGPGNASSLIRLSNTIISTIVHCWFGAAEVAIRGQVDSNTIQIRDSCFNYHSDAAIKNAGESWLIEGCTFERRRDLRAGAYKQDITYYAKGLSFVGNWFGDVTVPGGLWIQAKGLGIAVIGNTFGIYCTQPAPPEEPTCIRADVCVHITHSEGVHVAGNFFDGAVKGVEILGFVIGLSVMGNKFRGVTFPVDALPSITPNTAAFLGNSGLANYIA